MTPLPVCVLYTQDRDLVRRIKAYLRATSQVSHVAEADRLDAVLQQTGPALLLMDLRAKECRDLIDQVREECPEVLIVALGTARSEPLREAEQLGIYAAENLELDRRPFQALAERAFSHLKLMQENRDLRDRSTIAPVVQSPPGTELVGERYGASSPSMLRFPRVFRRFESVDALLASVVESVADAAGVTRVGIFSKTREGDRYQLRAGLRCLPETHELEFGERDPLVRWFERQAHLISRANLRQAADQKRAD